MKHFILTSLFIFASFFACTTANAAVYMVYNTNDSGPGSLREALFYSNTTPDVVDTIRFHEANFSSPQTIVLTSGELVPYYSVTIEGPGANLLTISGNNQSRIFYNNYSYSVFTLRNVTLTGGSSTNGGAIYSSCTTRLSNVVIQGNRAAGAEISGAGFAAGLGGGIYTLGSLTVDNSTFRNNLASGVIVKNTSNPAYGDGATSGGGGAIYAQGSEIIVVNCQFSGNTARGASSPDTTGEFQSGSQGGTAFGGAIYSPHGPRIINSTFINNSALAGNGASIISTTFGHTAGFGGEANGGAVRASRARILNSTFRNNSAIGGIGGRAPQASGEGNGRNGIGGAIYDRDLQIANSTIVGNSVIGGAGRGAGDGFGGGIYLGYSWSVVNSTITGNTVTGGKGTQSNGLSQGGGIFTMPAESPPNFFYNNIVAENSASSGGTDIFGSFINSANNLVRVSDVNAIGLTNGANGNLVGSAAAPIDPMLAPLTNNGGFTETRALLAGSPAINAGNNTYALNPFDSQILQYDQRNLQRIAPINGTVDIGSFEFSSNLVAAAGTPDLQDSSDTGLSNTDNITRSTAPVFNISNAAPGTEVELVRNGVPVSSVTATSFTVALTDPNPPLDGVFQYTSRQRVNNAVSPLSPALSVTFDNTPPTVTINQASTQADPGTITPIRFTAVFSEPVGGLEGTEISLAGSTADVSGASVFTSYLNPSTINIEVSGIRSPGTVVATIPALAAYDFALNYSSASTSTDNSVNFQPNIAEVSISGRVRRNAGLLRTSATVTFTDNFTGEVRTTRTNNLGYYNFTRIRIYQQIGSRFTVTISGKGIAYNSPQPITITGNRSNLNFTVP